MEVTKETIIGEIVSKHPNVVEIMLSYGLHCVGCGAAGLESIEQGMKVHGFDDTAIDNLVKDINSTLNNNEDFKITEKAIKKVKELMKEGECLYISVVQGGCSGFNYVLDFKKEASNEDVTLDLFGLKIFVEKNSLEYLKGTELDYVENSTESGFKFSNPNLTHKCGCSDSV